MEDMPQIIKNKCDGCGLCVSICGCRIIALVDNKATVIPHNRCESCQRWCTLCEDICPKKAIYCSFDVVIESKPESV